jgi:hypothetical protein
LERVGEHKTSYRMGYAVKELMKIEQMMNLVLAGVRQAREIRMFERSNLEPGEHKPIYHHLEAGMSMSHS